MTLRWRQSTLVTRTFLVLLALYVLLEAFSGLSGLAGTLRSYLVPPLFLLGLAVLVRLMVRGIQALVRRFLWRVRYRMIAVYVFVGLITLTLALMLSGLASFLVVGPLASDMVTSSIDQQAVSLHATARALARELRRSTGGERRRVLDDFLPTAAQNLSGLTCRVEAEGEVALWPADLPDLGAPAFQADYGITLVDGRLLLFAQLGRPDGGSVVLSVPLTLRALNRLLPGLGPVVPREVRNEPARQRAIARLLPSPANPFDYALPWPATLRVWDWRSGEERMHRELALVTRPSAVYRLLFSRQPPETVQFVRRTWQVLVTAFGLTLLISLFIAVSLTRTITGAIHQIYEGTQRVHVGDLSHRIAWRGDDQLGELAHSFNSMTASIESLIEDSKERQRLQSELEIAREVQNCLFPRGCPRVGGIELLGLCRPAQSVSGDFYDYVQLSSSRLAVALGDVSGKGISAALVMATLHSLVRTQLSLLGPTGNGAESTRLTTELLVRLNRQLHESTAPEKFVTLFFGTYDEDGVLTYGNAGHLPPLLLRNGSVQRLDVSGLVLGAFPEAPYAASSVRLQRGDVLVAFTDGVTEPENPYGDQFGETRLLEVLRREAGRPLEEIIHSVMTEVETWTGSPILQDDMTMLVMRRP